MFWLLKYPRAVANRLTANRDWVQYTIYTRWKYMIQFVFQYFLEVFTIYSVLWDKYERDVEDNEVKYCIYLIISSIGATDLHRQFLHVEREEDAG